MIGCSALLCLFYPVSRDGAAGIWGEMSNEKWEYGNAEWNRHGKMECMACGEVITEGEYKYKEVYKKFKFMGYMNHYHRKCSESDHEWRKRDKEKNELIESEKQRLKDYEDLRDKWQDGELDEVIESIRSSLA